MVLHAKQPQKHNEIRSFGEKANFFLLFICYILCSLVQVDPFGI